MSTARSDFERDHALPLRYLDHLRQICGLAVAHAAPFEDDVKRATDLIVITRRDVRFACRVRRHIHLEPYGHQFTIRASRPTGAKTELEKILAGWGDYLIYGFAPE